MSVDGGRSRWNLHIQSGVWIRIMVWGLLIGYGVWAARRYSEDGPAVFMVPGAMAFLLLVIQSVHGMFKGRY